MNALDLLFPLALVLLGIVGVVALRHPLLSAIAWRNTQRRRRQSALVILGLLVGTAIVSGALVAGDSMGYAIVEATYDAFQGIDETVYLDGYNFFPQSVGDALAADLELDRATDAVGSNILWDAAVTDERSNQYEPNVRLVGFDPERDQVFGPFRRGGTTFDGTDLGPNDVVVYRDLTKKLDVRVGDTLTLNFTRPQDPLLPRFQTLEGQINASARLPVLDTPAEPEPWSAQVEVPPTTVVLRALLVWDPRPAQENVPILQDLDLELESPAHVRYANLNGTAGAPDVPAWLNLTGSLAAPLEAGAWTVRVTAEAALQTRFNLTLITLDPVYDLAEFDRRSQELRTRFEGMDPSEFDQQFPRETHSVRVAALFDEGKGPNFKLPNSLTLYLRLDTLQAWLERGGQVNFVKISNPGGVEEGARHTDAVYPLVWERLNATKAQFPDHPAIQALKANNDKQFWLEQAEQVGQVFSLFLAFVGSFSVIAGLMLIINIFTMLAEERKTELGISRAVGLKQRHLARLFVLEGTLYALPAALLGTFAGLGLAAGLIVGFNTFGDSETFPAIPFRLEPSSLLLAFALGITLTLATVYVAARRAARLNVVRAIRNLEEPEQIRGRLSLWGGLLLASIGVGVALYAVASGSFAAQVLGPTALAVGASLLLRRVARRQLIYPTVAALLLTYLTLTLFLKQGYEGNEGNFFGPVRAVLMALCVVVLVVYTEAVARGFGRLLRALPPLRAIALPAASYPLYRKYRTALTLSMFAVILLVVTLFSIFGSLFQPDPGKESGGYDVEGFAQEPLDRLEDHGSNPALLDRVAYYDLLPYYLQFGGTLVRVDNQTTGQFGPPQDYVFGLNASFADRNRFALVRRDPAYATDAEAYRAVNASRDLAIVSYSYSTDQQGNDDRHRVGSEVQLEAHGGVRTFRIVGIMEQYHLKGVFVAQPALEDLFANRDTLVLLALKPHEDPERAARDFEAAYRDVGLNAESIRSVVLEQSQQFRQIFTLIQLFLSLGLIVGILSLGIVTARSVIERRQEIGMLRAVGYRRRDIRRTFLFEMWLMVGLGVLIGAAVALLVSFGLWVSLIQELKIPYVVPWTELLLIATIAFVATTLATLAPIIRAARIPPAEALRYIE